jgi:hypothetical protein
MPTTNISSNILIILQLFNLYQQQPCQLFGLN